MFSYNFTYATTFNIDFFYRYMFDLVLNYTITNLDQRDMKYVTVYTDRELTATEQTELNNYIQNYSDFNQTIINESILEKCKAWGKTMMLEFELKNMVRKDSSIMARQELKEVMKEIHNSFVFMSMLEGSLDTLHGILNGYPEQTINSVVWAAEAPYSFTYTWTEDIDWLKSELNNFLATL